MRSGLVDKIEQKNIQQTTALLLALLGFMFLIGWLLAGKSGSLLTVLVFVFLVFSSPYRSAHVILKVSGARLIDPTRNVDLYGMLGKICRRAGLDYLPKLYHMPSDTMNAFVVGNDNDSSIVFTDRLLQHLDYRELAGIIGHEVAHIRNNDLWVMSVSDIAVRMTHIMSTTGQVLLLFALPGVFAGEVGISFFGLLFLVFAPTICLFMHNALSRTREYEADRVGAELAGDIYGLISALQKLEKYHLSLMKRMFAPRWIYSVPSLLLTHPPTKDRIRQLLQMDERINRGWPGGIHSSHAW